MDKEKKKDGYLIEHIDKMIEEKELRDMNKKKFLKDEERLFINENNLRQLLVFVVDNLLVLYKLYNDMLYQLMVQYTKTRELK